MTARFTSTTEVQCDMCGIKGSYKNGSAYDFRTPLPDGWVHLSSLDVGHTLEWFELFNRDARHFYDLCPKCRRMVWNKAMELNRKYGRFPEGVGQEAWVETLRWLDHSFPHRHSIECEEGHKKGVTTTIGYGCRRR